MSFHERLREIPLLSITRDVPLSRYTRFGIGGPADAMAETSSEEAFMAASKMVRAAGVPLEVIGGGSNLIVSDAGFRGVVLRFIGGVICVDGARITAQAGAELQALVDVSIAQGLGGIHTMTRIPGLVGAAVYGNAGAYGHSIHEWVEAVRFFDGSAIRTFNHAQCEFRYRESLFKRHKEWTIFSTILHLKLGDSQLLSQKAEEIRAIRDEKYPPTMKCAGSIFKNLLYANLPAAVQAQVPADKVREGKVPSAYFLEKVGAKGMRIGGIVNADHHANLIYNEGNGTAAQVCAIVDELKSRIRERFHFDLEEEVQYVGFEGVRKSF